MNRYIDPPSASRFVFLLFGTIGLSACELSPIAQGTAAGESLSDYFISMIAAWGTPLLAYLILRPYAVHRILRRMMSRAPGIDAGADDAETGRASTAAVAPGVLDLDRTRDLVLDDRLRDRVRRALGTGRRTGWIFAGSVLVFTSTAVGIESLTVSPDPAAIPGVGAGGDLLPAAAAAGGAILGASLPYLLGMAALVLLLYTVSHTTLVGRMGLKTTVALLLLLAGGWSIAGLLLGIPAVLLLVPGILAGVVVVMGYRALRAGARADGNLQLLVLRVFGADRSTAFLFGGLTRAWRHVGSFITVVDPSYIRYQFSVSSPETRLGLLRFVAAYGVLISLVTLTIQGFVHLALAAGISPALLAWRDLPAPAQSELLGILGWFVLIPMAFVPISRSVNNRFQDSGKQLDERVQSVLGQRMKWDATFPGYPMYCFDNVWRRAVRSLLDVSDAVLMDLRGFTPERAGCEYEIGLLLDRFPLSRTVFLVDRTTRADVLDLIRSRARSTRTDSPNLGLAQPTLQLYAPDAEEGDDIPRIVAALAAAAGADPARAPLATTDAPARNRLLDLLAAPLRALARLWRRVALAVDMVLGTPRHARVAAPLAFACVALLLGLRIVPLWRSFQAYQPVSVALDDDRVVIGDDAKTEGSAIVGGAEPGSARGPPAGVDATAPNSTGLGDFRVVAGGSDGEIHVLGEGAAWADAGAWVEGRSGERRPPSRVGAFYMDGRRGREFTFSDVAAGATLIIAGGFLDTELAFRLDDVPIRDMNEPPDVPPWTTEGNATASVPVEGSSRKVLVHASGYRRPILSFDRRGGFQRPLELHVLFQGGPAADATAFGRASLTASVGASDPIPAAWVEDQARPGETGRDLRAEVTGSTLGGDPDGFRMLVTFPNPGDEYTALTSVHGSVVLRRPDPDRSITVRDVARGAMSVDRGAEPVRVVAWGSMNPAAIQTSTSGPTIQGPVDGRIEFRGGVAARAWEFGMVEITAATGPDGEPLEVRTSRFPKFDLAKEFRSAEGGPTGGVWMEFGVRNVGGLTGIGRMAGNVTFRVPGKSVTVRDLASTLARARAVPSEWGPQFEMWSVQLQHEALAPIGKVSLVRRKIAPDDLFVEVEGAGIEGVSVVLVAADGSIVRSRGVSTATVNGRRMRGSQFPLPTERLEGAALEFILGYETEVVEFDLRDIPIAVH